MRRNAPADRLPFSSTPFVILRPPDSEGFFPSAVAPRSGHLNRLTVGGLYAPVAFVVGCRTIDAVQHTWSGSRVFSETNTNARGRDANCKAAIPSTSEGGEGGLPARPHGLASSPCYRAFSFSLRAFSASSGLSASKVASASQLFALAVLHERSRRAQHLGS